MPGQPAVPILDGIANYAADLAVYAVSREACAATVNESQDGQNLGCVMSAMGRLPSHGKMSFLNRASVFSY